MASLLSPPCPSNSFLYNTSMCACDPGYLYNVTTKSCELFRVTGDAWVVGSGVDYSVSFPETIFSLDSIKKFTQSQAVFLEATLILLFSWLAFCFFLRFCKLRDGRNIWFQIRWWISRLDICFSTRHWLTFVFNSMNVVGQCEEGEEGEEGKECLESGSHMPHTRKKSDDFEDV